jgi:hypothetical protein
VKVTALEVPLAVLIATCAEGVAEGGTVTLQVFGAGQLVVATWPLNVATIWPLELSKQGAGAPLTSTRKFFSS